MPCFLDGLYFLSWPVGFGRVGAIELPVLVFYMCIRVVSSNVTLYLDCISYFTSCIAKC